MQLRSPRAQQSSKRWSKTWQPEELLAATYGNHPPSQETVQEVQYWIVAANLGQSPACKGYSSKFELAGAFRELVRNTLPEDVRIFVFSKSGIVKMQIPDIPGIIDPILMLDDGPFRPMAAALNTVDSFSGEIIVHEQKNEELKAPSGMLADSDDIF
jgi:hypothetical protein